MKNKLIYRELSKRKRNIISKEFCEDLIKELRKTFNIPDRINSIQGFYYYICETCDIFIEPLEKVCIKHGLKKPIFDYFMKLDLYRSDVFGIELMDYCSEKGVIPFEITEDEKKACEHRVKALFGINPYGVKYKDYTVYEAW